MPSFCVVSNCEYKYAHADNISFHKFPHHNPELLAKWISFAERSSCWQPSRWSAICSRHFLPSDFRDYLSRKCLRKNAIPSIIMKQFDGNFLNIHRECKNYEIREECKSNCRLCGVYSKQSKPFLSNFEICEMIQKCFPSINITQEDKLPKYLCTICLQHLKHFSDFVNRVLQTQKQLGEKILQDQTNSNNEKQIKIKQEPVINVKQEISDVSQSYFSDEFDEENQSDRKSQLIGLPFIPAQEIINNSDIMEIIPLDDGFIDIPDDGIEENELQTETKDNFFRGIYTLLEEHSYAAMFYDNHVNINNYKTEKFDDIDLKQTEIYNENLDIIVINGSVGKNDPYKNEVGNQNVLSYNTFNNKNQTAINKTYICVLCHLTFDTIIEFLRHKIATHRTNKKSVRTRKLSLCCLMCKKAFNSKLALNNHIKYICIFRPNEKYECKYCSKILHRLALLKIHERNCNNFAINKKKKNTKATKTQIKTIEKRKFVCPICDRSYNRSNNLYKHQITHRPHDHWNFKCGDCDTLFDYMQDLRQHLKTNKCRKSSRRSEQIVFICTTCGKQLKSFQSLKLHSSIHSTKKPYVCETCGKAFRCFNNLYQHKITHSNIRRYKCDMCEKYFKRRGGLNQHKRSYHFKLKPYECTACKRKFALKGDMIRCKHSILK